MGYKMAMKLDIDGKNEKHLENISSDAFILPIDSSLYCYQGGGIYERYYYYIYQMMNVGDYLKILNLVLKKV